MIMSRAHTFTSTTSMAVGDDDWLVADSEDEEFPPENGPRVSVSTRAAAAGGLTSPKGKL